MKGRDRKAAKLLNKARAKSTKAAAHDHAGHDHHDHEGHDHASESKA